MYMLHQVKNSLRGLLHRHGPETIKRRMWNLEFASGRWNCLDSVADDCVLPYLNALARGGSILDVGCGPGALGEALDPGAYRRYLGVDISDVAIAKARARSSRAKNGFVQGDMRSFTPPGSYDVILFGDSLYYFSLAGAKAILSRYCAFLSERGVFVMRCWVLNERTRAIVRLIESDYEVSEKKCFAFRDPMVVIVFRSRSRTAAAPPAQRHG